MWPMLALVALVTAILLARLWHRQRRRADDLRRDLDQARRDLEVQAGEQARLHQQAALRRELLFDSMGDGVLLLDGGERVQVANRAFCRLFGLPAGVRGRPIQELVRLPAFHALLAKVIEQGVALSAEMELPGPENRIVEVSATRIQPADPEGAGLILVVHDLTRLKRLENTRKEFVANVSHELRTPLSLIKGCVETLLDGARHDPATNTRFLRTIQKHTDRLTFLIEDLLTISRLESGAIVVRQDAVRLRPLADRVIEDLRRPAGDKQVTVQNELPDDLVAHADADRIQQVLFNLVDNALKYGRSQGHIWIGGRPLPGQRLEVWVRDDGPGIPPNALNRVYERFYRVDRARSRDQGGTGLGLSIVKHIVQSHGGEVRTESEPGQGATFRFTLPAARPDTPNRQPDLPLTSA